MSDTPRTDALAEKRLMECDIDYDDMDCLARTLERELAAMRERGEKAEAELREVARLWFAAPRTECNGFPVTALDIRPIDAILARWRGRRKEVII